MPDTSLKFQRALYSRYLLWAYKTTRESFERIERKTTQLVVDEHVRCTMAKTGIDLKEFDQYIADKKADEIKLKYTDETKEELHPQYIYLKNRLVAIEKAVKELLGEAQLKHFEDLFEAEFTRRILESRDQH